MIHKGDRYPRGLHRGSRKIHLLTKGERTIYVSPAAAKAAFKLWLTANVVTTASTVVDADGRWFEIAVELPDTFAGDASSGWTGPWVDGKPDITLALFYSTNLTSWAQGGWIPAPDKPPESLGGGRKRWHARYETTPQQWFATLSSHRLTSRRQGKEITHLTFPGLTGYPYAMPADAATLQADLIAAGYADATVTVTSQPLTLTIFNYLPTGKRLINYTMVSDAVTVVTDPGSGPITLPGYPYAIPADAADLQADLITAGYSGAVVTVFGDEWEIFVPDLDNVRGSVATFTPGDPFPVWDMFGNPQADNPANTAAGVEEDLRNPLGDPLTESTKGFARIGQALT